MKKFIILVLVVILTGNLAFAATKKEKSVLDISYETKDKFLIKAKLSLPFEKRERYPMVVLMHSIGYSSEYWLDLPTKLRQAGFAVLEVDFRGHGKSIYDANLKKINWYYLSAKAYGKFPQDVLGLLLYINQNYKKISVSNLVFVGADIGANTAILSASQLKTKPVLMVLISPSRQFKGLYTPIALTDIKCPILVIYSQKDTRSKIEAANLAKFAQNSYSIKTYPNGGPGMLMLKVNKNMDTDIANWITQKLNIAANKKIKK